MVERNAAFVEPADVVQAGQHFTVAEKEARLAQQRMLFAQSNHARDEFGHSATFLRPRAFPVDP